MYSPPVLSRPPFLSRPPVLSRQYSKDEWVNEDDPFSGYTSYPTRRQMIYQLEEENKNIKALLVDAAKDRQACKRQVAALESHLRSIREFGRLGYGGRKSRRKRRRRKTKKRKTNRKRRKTKRKTKRKT